MHEIIVFVDFMYALRQTVATNFLSSRPTIFFPPHLSKVFIILFFQITANHVFYLSG
jgi:hypothetical protein